MSKVISLRIEDELSEALEYQAAAEEKTVNELIKGYLTASLIKDNPFWNIELIHEVVSVMGNQRPEEIRQILMAYEAQRSRALFRLPDADEEKMLLFLHGQIEGKG